MMSLPEIEDFLLKLPVSERARIAAKLWTSIANDRNAQSDPSFDHEWLKLAQKRVNETENGTVEPIDHKEFLRLIRKQTKN